MHNYNLWSNEHKNFIENAEKQFGLHIATGSGNGDGNPITCNVGDLLNNNYDLVVSFQHSLNIFVIWSTDLNKSFNRTRFEVGKSELFLNAIRNINGDMMVPYYKQVKDTNQNPLGYHKILLVGNNRLQNVVEHYEDYIFPNPEDEGYKQPVWTPNEHGVSDFISISDTVQNALVNANISRSKENITRKHRDYRFRHLVLERWNNRCAVCGETEQLVLQAAHIQAVGDGGNDDPTNGICLCANHHLMFDGENGKQLITISDDQKTFSCSSNTEIQKEWYKEAKNRGLTLLPNNDQ